MGFKELIRKVQRYSGFSSQESKDALELMVEGIAVRLDEPNRKDFASELPEALSDIALSVYPSQENSTGNIVEQFVRYGHIEEKIARRQVSAAWKALSSAVSKTLMQQIAFILSSPNQPVLV